MRAILFALQAHAAFTLGVVNPEYQLPAGPSAWELEARDEALHLFATTLSQWDIDRGCGYSYEALGAAEVLDRAECETQALLDFTF